MQVAAADVPVTALLRDYQQVNLDAARAARRGTRACRRTTQSTSATRSTARSLAAVAPRPTIAIVSGLYELFPDNEPLRRSLAAWPTRVEPGGYLIYTCQPWHPQVEFIARVLTNREGQPWVMRRRTQAEMDELVRDGGLSKGSISRSTAGGSSPSRWRTRRRAVTVGDRI